MSHRMTVELTVDALRQAVVRREARPVLMHHSDRRAQCAATEYQKLLTEAEMLP